MPELLVALNAWENDWKNGPDFRFYRTLAANTIATIIIERSAELRISEVDINGDATEIYIALMGQNVINHYTGLIPFGEYYDNRKMPIRKAYAEDNRVALQKYAVLWLP